MIHLKKEYKTGIGTEVRGLFQDGVLTFGYYKCPDSFEFLPCTWETLTGFVDSINSDTAYSHDDLRLIEVKTVMKNTITISFLNNGAVLVNGSRVQNSKNDADSGLFATKQIELVLEEGEGLISE